MKRHVGLPRPGDGADDNFPVRYVGQHAPSQRLGGSQQATGLRTKVRFGTQRDLACPEDGVDNRDVEEIQSDLSSRS
jgi:hypothetical protein